MSAKTDPICTKDNPKDCCEIAKDDIQKELLKKYVELKRKITMLKLQRAYYILSKFDFFKPKASQIETKLDLLYKEDNGEWKKKHKVIVAIFDLMKESITNLPHFDQKTMLPLEVKELNKAVSEIKDSNNKKYDFNKDDICILAIGTKDSALNNLKEKLSNKDNIKQNDIEEIAKEIDQLETQAKEELGKFNKHLKAVLDEKCKDGNIAKDKLFPLLNYNMCVVPPSSTSTLTTFNEQQLFKDLQKIIDDIKMKSSDPIKKDIVEASDIKISKCNIFMYKKKPYIKLYFKGLKKDDKKVKYDEIESDINSEIEHDDLSEFTYKNPLLKNGDDDVKIKKDTALIHLSLKIMPHEIKNRSIKLSFPSNDENNNYEDIEKEYELSECTTYSKPKKKKEKEVETVATIKIIQCIITKGEEDDDTDEVAIYTKQENAHQNDWSIKVGKDDYINYVSTKNKKITVETFSIPKIKKKKKKSKKDRKLQIRIIKDKDVKERLVFIGNKFLTGKDIPRTIKKSTTKNKTYLDLGECSKNDEEDEDEDEDDDNDDDDEDEDDEKKKELTDKELEAQLLKQLFPGMSGQTGTPGASQNPMALFPPLPPDLGELGTFY